MINPAGLWAGSLVVTPWNETFHVPRKNAMRFSVGFQRHGAVNDTALTTR